MNLSKRAFEGLKFNMVPRKMFIRRLVEKYRKEQLKMKTIKSLKMLITRKQYIQHWKYVTSTNTRLRYFVAWINLYNEKSYAKALKVPFMNVQKHVESKNINISIYQGNEFFENQWTNLDKVYSFLSFNKRKFVFKAWRNFVIK